MHSKLTKVIITGVAIGSVGIGSTYAWWTAESEATYTVKTGKMSVKTDFTNIENQTEYEPGLNVEGDGIITNTGSVDALVKISDNSQIKFSRDENGDVIASEARVFEPADKEAIQMQITPQIDESIDDAFWFQGKNGDLYALMIPGSELVANIQQDFLGDQMDNHYMAAVVNTKLKANATQAIEEAVLSNFDESMNDLVPYEESSDVKTFSTSDYASRAMDFLHKVMEKQ